ncbi:hypothetical protein CTAYLR_006235 [Chrysophaeum taylorii]|uniref:Uncharacterized protein n=1 Tax=Chrysophaeum taylorii TaxID=2483200 RepID=A0AAD7UJS6_9STRA|nr:hypothetical protein CTAYLR_006235 [Chrysophaeum taylorii]
MRTAVEHTLVAAVYAPFREPNDVANPRAIANAHGITVTRTDHGANSRSIDAAERVSFAPFERAIRCAIFLPFCGLDVPADALPVAISHDESIFGTNTITDARTDGHAQLLPIVYTHDDAEPSARAVTEPSPFDRALLDPKLVALLDPQFDAVSSAHRTPV